MIEVHRCGFRAQFARPVLFAHDGGDGDRARVAALGRLHGVEVCALDELADRALEFGRCLTDALGP